MIQAVPGKARYQAFIDHDRPGEFLFFADFADIMQATHYAEQMHATLATVDVVVLDAKRGTLVLMLPGRRTLDGASE